MRGRATQTPFAAPEPHAPDAERLGRPVTAAEINAYIAARERWIARERGLRLVANQLAQTAGFHVRQHYRLSPTDPRYLEMDDLDIRIEAKAIEAYAAWRAGKPLPGEDGAPVRTDHFDTLAELIEQDAIPDEFWESGVVPPPPRQAAGTVPAAAPAPGAAWEDVDPDSIPIPPESS